MITTDSIHTLRSLLQAQKELRARVALVPTMGNLHEGHISLLKIASRECDFVVTSVFVNPMQFGPHEDFESYPRTLLADQEKLASAGCSVLFIPKTEEMYPDGFTNICNVNTPNASTGLCDQNRPGHFQGVATVVTKLFNIVQPDVAVFGHKDYQQLSVIKRISKDLNFPTRILGAPTVRSADGLALSSRNTYLSPDERKIAPQLYKSLKTIAIEIEQGARDFPELIAKAKQRLKNSGFQVDYLEIRSSLTLDAPCPADTKLIILASAVIGTTRLIDNIELSIKSPYSQPS